LLQNGVRAQSGYVTSQELPENFKERIFFYFIYLLFLICCEECTYIVFEDKQQNCSSKQLE